MGHGIHHTDQRRIQPTTSEFRLVGEPGHTQVPSTPVNRLRPFRRDGSPERNVLQESPQGSVTLRSPSIPPIPSSTTRQSPLRTPPSSRYTANIGIHRAQHSSMLLRSPARPGHASRMRQIFNDASMENTIPQDNGVLLYPQPPTIPPPGHRDQERPESPLPSIQANETDLAAAPKAEHSVHTPTHSPTRSAESRSSSSDYFITEPPPQVSTPNVSFQPRIYDWLSTVSEDGSFSQEETLVISTPAFLRTQTEVKQLKLRESSTKFSRTPAAISASQRRLWNPSRGIQFCSDPFRSPSNDPDRSVFSTTKFKNLPYADKSGQDTNDQNLLTKMDAAQEDDVSEDGDRSQK